MPRDCDHCENLVNTGPNWVPYGDTYVNSGDVWVCRHDYADPEECAEIWDEDAR